MTIPFWHVDAFTGSVFGGNPAGVCLLDRWLQPSLMQRIQDWFSHLLASIFGIFGLVSVQAQRRSISSR